MREAVKSARAPEPVGLYPHARRAGGLLFLSGIGPRRPGTNEIPSSFEEQCRSVFDNVRIVLEDAGARWEDLVDVTVYLTDMLRDFGAYNAIWAEYFPEPTHAPCRTTVGITALPTPIAIELKCTAVLPSNRMPD